MPFAAQPNEKCTACGRTVYLTEKAVVDEKTEKKVFHKTCIRCQTCNKVLSVGQYSSMDSKFWCKPHFKQLFATKGNYDEAFGIEKKQWEATNNTNPTSSGPSSFVPEAKSEKQESKPTSEATLAKFRKFREEGEQDKCVSCGKTVYLAEKMQVEDKNDKRLFHKACFKCNVCGLILDLRSYGSVEGKIYCKKDLKDVQAASNPTATTTAYSTAPTSFIPSTSEEKKTEKSQTPENIASKFRGVETEKCKACGKSVYATEKVIIPESFKVNSIFHKNCLKCSICKVKLDVTNYGSANRELFCTVHLKQYGKPEQAKGDGTFFVSPLAKADSDYVPGPKEGDDNPRSDDEGRRDNYSDRERENEDDRDRERDTSDRERDSYSDREQVREPEQRDSDRETTSSYGRSSPALERRDSGRSSPALERRDSGRSSPAIESTRERSGSASRSNDEDESKRKEEERNRRREEMKRQQEEQERIEEEERERKRKERERRIAESANEGTSGGDDDRTKREAEREERRRRREEERKKEDEERALQEEKRKKEREERKRLQEEESQRELEEQDRRAEERRRKLAELKGDA